MTIDILMPFYGDPAQFKEAVQSVLQQRNSDWRLVVINDCYPEWDPNEWLTGLGDDRIVSLSNSENLGVNGSFARCIDLAKAEYATILGCDDRLLPNYVDTVVALIERFDRPDYLQPGVRVIDDDGNVTLPISDRVKTWVRPRIREPQVLSGEQLVSTLMQGNWTYFPAICWRVDRLRRHRFSEEFEIVLDLALQFDILLDGGRFAVTPELAFEYRRHAASASSFTASDGTRFSEERDFYRSAAQRLAKHGWMRAARAARRRSTSRLNALTKVPGAVLRRNSTAFKALMGHVIAR